MPENRVVLLSDFSLLGIEGAAIAPDAATTVKFVGLSWLAAKLGAGQVQTADIANDILTAIKKAVISPNYTCAPILIWFQFNLAAGPQVVNIYNANAPFAFVVDHMGVLCTTAHAAGNIRLRNNAAAAITDLMNCAVANAAVDAATITKANATIAAGQTMALENTVAAVNGSTGDAYILAHRI